jgi:hypothetical protein
VAVVILRMYWWIPVSATAGKQGCQIFVGTWYQNRKNVPNQHEIYQMVIKIPEGP